MFQIEKIVIWFRKNFTRTDVLLIIGLIAAYFITRLINLDKYPIFSDEGIYIRWAKVAWKDASWRFISLTDGKQPLQTWGTIPFLKLFPTNALLAGRLFSVTTGFVALAGIFTLLFYLFNKKTAYVGSLLYIVTPYFVFYDRMALVDSGVNAGFIWMLFFSILLAKTRQIDVALLFGFVTGFSLLAKSSVRLFVGLSALAPLLFINKKSDSFIKSINYYILFSVSVVIGLLFYNVQRLSAFFHYIAQKNTTFVMSTSEFLTDPFKVIFVNLRQIPLYVFWELGWLIVPLAFLGYYLLIKNNRRLGIYLLIWLILPYIMVAFVTKVLFPRYLIFFASLLLITASYFIAELKSKTIFLIILAGLSLYQLIYSSSILFNPARLNFPEVDRGQYVEGSTAVWGAQDLVSYVREKSKAKQVLLLGEGDFGLVADVLRVFVNEGDQIEVKGLWPFEEKDIFEYQKVNDRKVYMVFAQRKEFPVNWPIRLVQKYTKPGNREVLYLFEYK